MQLPVERRCSLRAIALNKPSAMRALARLWKIYLHSGSRHFHNAQRRKLNRVLNFLFALNMLGAGLLVVAEALIFLVLLNRDFERYIKYLLPFGSLGLIHFTITGFTIWLKNKTGSFNVTYLSNLSYTLYILLLCVFVGEEAKIHLILLMVIPTSFIIYQYGRWIELFIHSGIMLIGLAAAHVAYEVMQPLYPMPADIGRIAGYLSWLAALGMLYTYSLHNWREVSQVEQLLADERDLTHKLLQQTIPKLEKTEAKYRHLVDDSSDLIFQLDPDCNILSMNKTSQRLLSFLPEDMLGKSLLGYIQSDNHGEPDVNLSVFVQQVNDLQKGRRPNRFRTRFKHKHRSDGVELYVILQLARFEGEIEIMGHATEVEPEVTLQILDQEKGRYTLTNNILHADILAQRISDRISVHFSLQELNAIRTCFREILINAIEHGNLGVTFEEKSAVIENGDFMEFLVERQRDERYASRRVRVVYLVTKSKLVLRVSDDGEGFDHRAFLTRAQTDDSLLYLEHGRGITMARNAFDEVVYNDKGNQVTLKKHLKRAAERAVR